MIEMAGGQDNTASQSSIFDVDKWTLQIIFFQTVLTCYTQTCADTLS